MDAIATAIWHFINPNARILSAENFIKWPILGGCYYVPVALEHCYFKNTLENQ